MLIYVNLDVGAATPLKVVLGAQVKDGGKDIFISFRTILGKERDIQSLATMGDRVQIVAPKVLNPSNNPDLVYPVVGEGSSTLDCTSVFNLFQTREVKEETFPQMVPALAKRGITLSLEQLKFIYASTKAMIVYRKGEDIFPIKAPALFFADSEHTLEAVKRHNGRLGPQFEHIKSEFNRNHFMNSETDTFYIAIPSLEKLKSPDYAMSALVPRPHELFIPYPHPIYGSVYAKKVLLGSVAQKQQALSDFGAEYKLSGPNRTSIPKIPATHVLGDAKNNDLPIQPNELDYYNALIEFIKYDISQTHPGGDVEDLYNKCMCSSEMLMYLQALVRQQTSYNWMHTTLYPINTAQHVDPEDDEDDDLPESDDRDYSSIEEQDEYASQGTTEIQPGHEIMLLFIENAAKRIGLTAYVEAIIKLSRWGERKPSQLKLGDYHFYLNLNTLILGNSSADYSSVEPVLIDGYMLEAVGVIIYDDKFRDTDFRARLNVESQWVTIPIGLRCVRHHAGGVKQNYYISLFEIIKTYRQDPSIKLIKGIDMVDGKLVVNLPDSVMSDTTGLLLAQEQVAGSADRMHINHITPALSSLKLEYKLQSDISLLSIISEFISQNVLSSKIQKMSFETKEELARKQAENPLPADSFVRVNIGFMIVGVVLLASSLYEKSGTQDLPSAFAAYQQTMDNLGIQSEDQFLMDRRPKEEPKAVEEIQQSNSFGTATPQPAVNQPAPEPVQPAATPSQTSVPTPETKPAEVVPSQSSASPADFGQYLFQPLNPDIRVFKILDEQGRVAAGFQQIKNESTGKTTRILCGPNEVPENAPVSSKTKFAAIEFFVYDTLIKMASNQPEALSAKFHSPNSLVEIRQYLRQVVQG